MNFFNNTTYATWSPLCCVTAAHHHEYRRPITQYGVQKNGKKTCCAHHGIRRSMVVISAHPPFTHDHYCRHQRTTFVSSSLYWHCILYFIRINNHKFSDIPHQFNEKCFLFHYEIDPNLIKINEFKITVRTLFELRITLATQSRRLLDIILYFFNLTIFHFLVQNWIRRYFINKLDLLNMKYLYSGNMPFLN